MSDSPLSEAAGDKVPVPMTAEHIACLETATERFHDTHYAGPSADYPKSCPFTACARLLEIEANLRSQVEGMKMYDLREIEALEMDRRMLAVWKTYNPAPGTIAKHAIVTDTCRANRTDEGAAREATERLVAEFLECAPAWENMGAQFHFTLTLQRPSNGATGIRTTAEQATRCFHPRTQETRTMDNVTIKCPDCHGRGTTEPVECGNPDDLSFEEHDHCEQCDGTGEMSERCEGCHGRGEVPATAASSEESDLHSTIALMDALAERRTV